MKKIIIALTGVLMLTSVISCKDALKETVYSELLAVNAYETEKDAEALITAVYAALRGTEWGAYYNYDYLYISEAPTDTYGLDVWEPGTGIMEMGLWDNNHAHIVNLWDGAYKVITSANFALDVLEGMDISADVKNRLRGEAHFLRGLAYYDLAFNFGQAVLNLGETTGNLPLSPQADIIAQAVADFTVAADLLGSTSSPGRASKGAALGMRAKTHLNAKNWNEAAADAQAVMNLGEYDLMPSVEELFDVANNAANEWIFVVMSTQDGTGTESVIPWFALSMNIQAGDWGRMMIAENFYKSFSLDDERRVLMANGYQHGDKKIEENTGKYIYFALPGTPEHDALAADTSIVLADLNSVPTTKYLGGHDRFQPADLAYYGVNYPVLRYADIILTRAEALNETGNTSEAIALVNQIRARSNMPQLSGLNQSQLRDAIFEERAREFYMEGHRRLDLIRSGKYIDLWRSNLEAKYPGENFNYLDDSKIYFPIPQKELDANEQIGG